jgi:hypothetical protein
MKIKEYNEMMAYLTRKKPDTKEVMNKKNDMETYVKNTTANNENPGSFQKLVKEDEAMEKRGQQTVALTNTASKDLRKQIKNGSIKQEDMILKEDDNGLMVNKNRTIAIRDSFIAKQFNKALGVNKEPEATPEQFGKLAERLERNRQMTGAKPTDIKQFKKSFGPSPFVKKKKVQHTPYKFPEFKIDPILPPSYFKPPPPDPETERLKQRFDQIMEESKRVKGLPGILGLDKKRYDKI